MHGGALGQKVSQDFDIGACCRKMLHSQVSKERTVASLYGTTLFHRAVCKCRNGLKDKRLRATAVLGHSRVLFGCVSVVPTASSVFISDIHECVAPSQSVASHAAEAV